MKKILFVDENHPILHETLINLGYHCSLFWDKPIDELINILPQYHGIVIRSKFTLTKDILQNATQLQCIGRVGAGLENIDVAFATQNNIVCINAPDGNKTAVAEHTLGMLLMLLNKLHIASNEVKNGIWKRAENRGTELASKTVAIIGYGNMGNSFAQVLSGMGCKILVYDKYKNGFNTPKITESFLQQIFEEADIVSLHVPYNEETKWYINNQFISSFKKSIYVINTARGKCLNTINLVEHLKNNKIIGACLDVLETESVSFETMSYNSELSEAINYLKKCERVILTPHIAGWTHESNYKMSEIIAHKMHEVLSK